MFVCHAQVIVSSRDQGIKLGIDISIIFIDYYSNVIDRHRNAFFTDEERNKASNPDLYMASKTDIEINQWAKYLLNEPLNPNLNTASSNFAWKDYGIPETLPKYSKESQPGRISHKDGNRLEEPHLTSFQKEYYSEQQQGQLINIIRQFCGTIIYIELSMSKQSPSVYVITLTH